ncbi:DUF3137 domain-containing protein [Faecalicatena contorta]|nr:DUF3137 domain-containing protein [Faecalicatena contorta]
MVLKNEEMNDEGEINCFTFFRGQWLICDLGKEFPGEVFISANPKKGKPSLERDVTMDNEEFNDRFCVKTKVPEEAFYILTPHMMEHILEMADKANGWVYMAFLRSGKIHIAVNTDRDIFELGDTKADYDTLHQKFLDELKWFADMIDALRLEDTL